MIEPVNQINTIPNVLYVDDDSDDCILLKESFEANTKDTRIVCASGGEEAIRYLHSIHNNPLPSLIILDLNMPRWDGRKTLSYIKSNPEFASIPVIILSTSENKRDKDVCARLGATSYLQKPFHYDGYRDIVRFCLPLIKH